MRVVFFGTPTLAVSFLESLLALPLSKGELEGVESEMIEVVGVVCQPDEPVGRKAILTAPPTKLLAIEHSIPVFQPTKLKDETFLASIDALHADVAVVIAYGRILPKTLLDRITHGFVNVHPSLLPKYRGPSPLQSAIVNGDDETGVTIMKLDEGMDTGPILAQTTIELAEDETTTTLTEKVIAIGAPLLIETLKGFVAGSIESRTQSKEGVSTCRLLTRDDGKIDWNESWKSIDQKVRGLTPWPGTWSVWVIDGKEMVVKIFGVKIVDRSSITNIGIPRFAENKLVIDCADATIEVIELQPAGGKRMSGADFGRGNL